MALSPKLITTLETALFFWNFFFFAIKNLHKISPCIYILVLLEEIDNLSSLTDQMSIYHHQFSRYIGAYIITFLYVGGENSVTKPGQIWCTQMHGKLFSFFKERVVTWGLIVEPLKIHLESILSQFSNFTNLYVPELLPPSWCKNPAMCAWTLSTLSLSSPGWDWVVLGNVRLNIVNIVVNIVNIVLPINVDIVIISSRISAANSFSNTGKVMTVVMFR